ncbi:MAG TPA: polynucleotide adenylyltransferase, partial [Verrucomicrobiae bacterium]|nr:polynucleotide adenylyltransferase [Verrucomicrobiae bacterium]
HTCHCCDALAGLSDWQSADSESKIAWMFAVLTHDFGKAATTQHAIKDGKTRVVSPGHEDAGSPLAESFLARIDAPRAIRERVIPLVVNHMAHFQNVTDRAIRRLAKRLEPENLHGLLTVMTADSFGRPPRPRIVPATIQEIARKAEELAVKSRAPEAILLGRHLLDRGFMPGRELGKILHEAYEAQLEGHFSNLDGAIEWLQRQHQAPRITRLNP